MHLNTRHYTQWPPEVNWLFCLWQLATLASHSIAALGKPSFPLTAGRMCATIHPMQLTFRQSVARRPLFRLLLALSLIALVAEVVLVLPRMLEVWQPYDYWQFTQMGQAVLAGQDPAAPGRYYPLPTVLWVFVPLALLPDWVRL